MLIRTVHRIQDFELVAGSSWMDDVRFDVDARAAADASPDEMRVMLRELLRERFGLTLRRERRQVPVYALRTIGDFGERLNRPPEDCATRARAVGGNAPTNTKGELVACGFRLAPGGLSARGGDDGYAGERAVDVGRSDRDRSDRPERRVRRRSRLDPYQLPPAPAFLSSPDASLARAAIRTGPRFSRLSANS